jgi:hypothetical protein
MLVGFYIPVEHAEELRLGLPCVLTLPEGK